MPVEQTGESTAGGGDAHRSLPTPFLTKTYQLVDDTAVDDVISWNEDGSTFIVWRPAEFARDLLPKYFKHNNFSSFVRQLNTYGFRKIVPDRWEFANDCFKKGEKRLLCDIHRRKISPTVTATGVPAAAIPMVMNGSPSNSGEEQVLSSNSPPVAVSVSAVVARTSCTSTSELLDENERLRRENQQLNQELTRMKSLCNNILVLMTNYANSHHDNNNNSNINNNNNVGGSGCVGEKPLDLMPITSSAAQNRVKMEEEIREMSPRLFGVPIGSKRIRREEVDEQVHQQQHQEPQPQEQQQQIGSDGVKSEPWDTSSNQQESTWRNTNCRSNERSCN